MPVFLLDGFEGIDESQGTTNARPGVAAAAHNIDTRGGQLATAQGYREAIPYPLPAPARRVMRFDRRTPTGTQTHILAATDTEVLVLREYGWHALMTRALSHEWTYVVWEQMGRDVIILANGADPVKKWYGDTDALQDLDGLPTPDGHRVTFKYLALHKERLWGAGYHLAPDSVFFSRPFDPENWTGDPLIPIRGSGEIAVPARDGSAVNGLRVIFEDIVIFRADKTMRIYGDNPENYQIVPIRGSYGPVSGESVVDAGAMCWYWTAEGLGYYDGMATGLVDDRKIPGTVRRVNPAAVARINGIMRGSRLYMALPLDGAAECSAILEYDAARQTYMLHEGMGARDFVYADATRETLYVAIGDRIMAQGGDTLGGAPIAASWTSPWYDLGEKSSIKTVTRVQAYGRIALPAGTAEDMAEMLITAESDRGRAAKRFTVRNGTADRLSASLLLTGTRFRVTVENARGSSFALDGGIELEITVKRGAY